MCFDGGVLLGHQVLVMSAVCEMGRGEGLVNLEAEGNTSRFILESCSPFGCLLCSYSGPVR
jgi:hypothetical protein